MSAQLLAGAFAMAIVGGLVVSAAPRAGCALFVIGFLLMLGSVA